MTTIYIVTEGSFSDYRIRGVFSTQENAQRYIDLYQLSDYYPDIEEYELDCGVDMWAQGYMSYAVWMLKNGDVTVVIQLDPGEIRTEPVTWADGRMRFDMWAKSDEHAIKIANERRTQMIANGEWQGKDRT